jgi:hypothetical protein
MSLLDQGLVSPRPQNHSRLSATGPPPEMPKTGPRAAADLTRGDEDRTGLANPGSGAKKHPGRRRPAAMDDAGQRLGSMGRRDALRACSISKREQRDAAQLGRALGGRLAPFGDEPCGLPFGALASA